MSFEIDLIRGNGFGYFKLAKDQLTADIDDDILNCIKRLGLSGKNVIDGGSNIGIMSLLFSEMVGKNGLVYCFELQRIIHQINCTNAIINGRTNIICFNNALSNISGEMVGFSKIDYEGENISSVGVKTDQKCGTISYFDRVQTIALDDFGIRNIGLIKLDLEGHEPEALQGMHESINRDKPYILIELSEGYLGKAVVLNTLDKIKRYRYIIEELSYSNYFCTPL